MNKLISLTLDFWNILKPNIDNNINNIKPDNNIVESFNNNYDDNCLLNFSDILTKEEYILSDDD